MAWADISDDGTQLTACCLRSENHLCKAVPGMNLARDGLWKAPLTWAAYVALRTAWSGTRIEISPRLGCHADLWTAMVQLRYQYRSALDAPDDIREMIGDIEAGGTRHLDPVQRAGAAWLYRFGRRIPGLSGAGLTDPTGAGKTPQVIRAWQLLALNGDRPFPALVVAPGSSLYAWRDKIGQWAPELSVTVVEGTAAKRAKALAGETPDVVLIAWPNLYKHTRLANYPSQAYVCCDEHGGSTGKTAARCEVHPKELNGIAWRTVVADEAHRMQDAKSLQTRAVWWLAWQAAYYWPVTGTPSDGRVEQIWPVCRGFGESAFPSKSRFLELFAVRDYRWDGGAQFLGIRPDTAASFHAITQPLWRRIPAEVARPYQPRRLEPEFRYPEMPHKAQVAYRALRKAALAELDGCDIVPQNTAVKFSRLRQLATAWLDEVPEAEDAAGFPDQRWKLVLPSHKADDLLAFLSDSEGQLVVSCYSPQLVALCQGKLHAAKITSCAVTGGMTAQAQYAAVRDFQEGRARVIFITAAGGEAIDLQCASTVLFLEPNPSARAREQVIGRVDRYGQQLPVRQVHVLTPGTVEQHIYDLGCDKAERAAQVTQDAALMRWMLSEADDADQ